MKKLFILILLFSFFSCEKDDDATTLSDKYSKQEIFNAVIGTWKFNRLAYDSEFKHVENVTYEECGRNNYTIFGPDSTITCIRDCGREELVEKGTFYVQFGDPISKNNVRIITERSGAILVPDVQYGNPILYNYTDSTLIFSNVTYYTLQGDIPNMYSELKRVK